jgi:Barrel-sandwich domain of CusB or HlyD membrane-fusion
VIRRLPHRCARWILAGCVLQPPGAEADEQQREASLKSAQVNLGYTNIFSPVDGTVMSRNITLGKTVAATLQAPILFLIATELTRMQVDTNVSESDVSGLREGASDSFILEAYLPQTYPAQVVQFRRAPQTVQNVVTYDVAVGVTNKDLRLKPGMTATTRIVLEQRDDALRVPDRALRLSPLWGRRRPRAVRRACGSVEKHRRCSSLGASRRASLELSQASYQAGQAYVLELITARRLYEQAMLGYAKAKGQRYLDMAQLLEALGGGWRQWDGQAIEADGNAN